MEPPSLCGSAGGQAGQLAAKASEDDAGGQLAPKPSEDDASGQLATMPSEDDAGGQLAAKPSEDDAGGQLAAMPSEDDADVDWISSLPDDVLIRILLRLDDAAAAGRTSVPSSRWRHLWLLLPELRFPLRSDPLLVAAALAAHKAFLSNLSLGTLDADAESVAAWLPAVAPRLTGHLSFTNLAPGRDIADDVGGEERGSVMLPCMANATGLTLDLGCRLSLAVPPAGVFTRLTEMSLTNVMFCAPSVLGDAVSSPRCPCLDKLTVRDIQGLDSLTICSDSLREMTLDKVRGLERLAVASPALEYLSVLDCFLTTWALPVTDISAPALKVLRWGDLFHRSSVHLGTMKHLETVCPMIFCVYASSATIIFNEACLELLQCFETIQCLCLTLVYKPYLPNIDDNLYLMEQMTMLPNIMVLNVKVTANGHAFGASLFHVLRLCSGIKELNLILSSRCSEEQTACPPGCICDEQQDWKSEELSLNHLQEVEITRFRGYANEVILLIHLLSWATELKKMKIIFNSLVNESMARQSYQILQMSSRLEISMEFYMDKDTMTVPYVPKD